MDSHKTQEKEHFYPLELVATLLKYLSNKEEDILRRRFGLNMPQKETLEEIGHSYNVTRERIRQIENNSVAKIKSLKNFDQLIGSVDHLINSIITDNGGFVEEQMLLENLVGNSDEKEMDSRAVQFFLQVLLKGKYHYSSNSRIRPTWGLKHSSKDSLEKAIEEFYKIIEKEGAPMSSEKIVAEFKKTETYKNNQMSINDNAIKSFLHVSKKIDNNPYGEFGLAEWGSITPKRINDKIYLVLKKNDKPMHFVEIAEEINRIKFDRRKAYPPTIHNELIMNKQYVLVGRGIYALKEWGYKPGVVADVLADILEKSDKPLKRKELVEEVLKKRIVKKNTIHLALTNRSRFKKLPDGAYALAEKK